MLAGRPRSKIIFNTHQPFFFDQIIHSINSFFVFSFICEAITCVSDCDQWDAGSPNTNEIFLTIGDFFETQSIASLLNGLVFFDQIIRAINLFFCFHI
jgi:hypothetical protein